MPKVKPETSLARRDEILKAAEICFARQGFHQTTISDVIRESGLSAGCIYGHFATKEDLIQAMGERRHAHDRALLSNSDDTMDPIVALRTIARDFLADVQRDFLADVQKEDSLRSRRVALQLWAEALRDDEVRKQVVSGIHIGLPVMVKLLQRGQRLGLVGKKIEPTAIARTIVAMFQGFVLQRVWGEPFKASAGLAAFDVFLRGLTAEG
jgi:AcrR family transcriptional regulator